MDTNKISTKKISNTGTKKISAQNIIPSTQKLSLENNKLPWYNPLIISMGVVIGGLLGTICVFVIEYISSHS
ncbi:MAG: hypothetical protein LBH55_01365 [Mycoplasmataceae bacterium]|nr:hypothetical protein [Mycoplasmataceae bacterium]